MEHIYAEDKTIHNTDFTQNPLTKGEYECCTFINCDFSNSDLAEIIFVECVFEGCIDPEINRIKKAYLEYGINLRKGAFDFMSDKI